MRTRRKILEHTAVHQEYLFNSFINLVNISRVEKCGSCYEFGNIQSLPSEWSRDAEPAYISHIFQLI
jgi:hypothetical protein